MLATPLADDAQLDRFVTLSELPLANVAVAVYWRVVPTTSLVGSLAGVFGVIAIETADGRTTVAVVLPTTFPFVAEIVTVGPVPVGPVPVASPVGVIEIFVKSEEAQVTLVVMTRVTLPEKCPVAVNCCCVLNTIAGIVGVTVIDCKVALVTVRVAAGLVMAPKVAVIRAAPVDTPVATPWLP